MSTESANHVNPVISVELKTAWTYEYPFGALFQHSVNLSDRLAFSPFFVIERESGRRLWEAPVTSERPAMLYARALSDGVIVAEKFENEGGKPQFRGIYRFDAATGTALDAPAVVSAGSFAAGVQGWLRGQRRGVIDLTAAKLHTVRSAEIVTADGDVVDIRTGNRVRRAPNATDAAPNWSPRVKLDANADFVSIPGFGELHPGEPPASNDAESDNRFWNQWPHSFHLRKGDDVVWAYNDEASRAAGLTGSLTYDQILPPSLYFLLYNVRNDDSASTFRDAVFDLALRRLDLNTGQVVNHMRLADGPVHKWPSIADVDERGIIVTYREANRRTTTFTYLGLA